MTVRRAPGRRLRAVPLAVTGILAVAGCGGPARSDVPVPAHGPPVGRVRVGLVEWAVETSSHRVLPGRVRLTVTNAGATTHDLVVSGLLGSWSTPDLAPGQQARLTVRARPGEVLRLWCSMRGHRTEGMHTTLSASR